MEHPALEDLRSIPVFKDLAAEDLEWLCSQMLLIELAPGEVLARAGDPADDLFVLVAGEIRGERESDGRTFYAHAGEVTGLLPFSRLTHFPATTRATTQVRGARLNKQHFTEMLRRIPVLQERLVSVMSDRIREATRADQQHEKLMALGKLSAGLAHELNNPAASGQRAADYLREAIKDFRLANVQLAKLDLNIESRRFLVQLEYEFAEKVNPTTSLDTLERSEREEQLADWLQKAGVKDAWRLAPDLVDAGCQSESLEQVKARLPAEFLGIAFRRLTASVTITKLLSEIENSIKKISDLVRAVKEYSYMDQMPSQEVDIHDGIENTLVMLHYRLKTGIEVVREYDRKIPRMTVHGSELNQVWTNLITNAIDAMNGNGKLRLVTGQEGDKVVVNVIDNGSGIPPQIKNRIFEPFFTTKGVNEGTGLGLDIAARIVRAHGGDIVVESKPGDTRFSVRLPSGHYSPDDHATRNSG